MTACPEITSADANVADMQLHFRERVKFFLAAGTPCVIKKASDGSSVSMASKEMCSFASFSFAAKVGIACNQRLQDHVEVSCTLAQHAQVHLLLAKV